MYEYFILFVWYQLHATVYVQNLNLVFVYSVFSRNLTKLNWGEKKGWNFAPLLFW